MADDDETARSTLDEARGAHRNTREILGLLLEEEAADPIEAILATLGQIATQQQAMMRRLESIERKLEDGAGSAGSPGSSRPRASGLASGGGRRASTSTPASA